MCCLDETTLKKKRVLWSSKFGENYIKSLLENLYYILVHIWCQVVCVCLCVYSHYTYELILHCLIQSFSILSDYQDLSGRMTTVSILWN